MDRGEDATRFFVKVKKKGGKAASDRRSFPFEQFQLETTATTVVVLLSGGRKPTKREEQKR